MEVRALKEYYYNRRMYSPGETFDMDESNHLLILVTHGVLERVGPSKPKPTPVITTRDLKAEEPEKKEEPDKRRIYRRRDLRAEP